MRDRDQHQHGCADDQRENAEVEQQRTRQRNGADQRNIDVGEGRGQERTPEQPGGRANACREQQANAQKAIMVQMRSDAAPGKEPTAAMEELLKEFLQRQLQLQQQYQDRMDDLQRQWLKMGHRLTIVYI